MKKETRKTDGALLNELLPLKVLRKGTNKGFKLLAGINRKVIPQQVTKLATSLNLMGFCRPVIVADLSYKKDNELYIIDGQHLYFASMRLDLDVPYRKIEVTSDQDLVEKIALLNSTSKSWTLQDYILAWSYIRPNYKKLSHYLNTYDIEISLIASMLHSGSTAYGSKINKVIKNGTLQIKNEARAVKLFDFITDALKIVPRMDRFSNRTFVAAYVEYINSDSAAYDHKSFMNFLKKNIKELKFVNGDKEHLLDFFNKA